MKKIVFMLFAVFFVLLNVSVNAFETSDSKQGREQKTVSEIGFKILNANQIPNRVVFYYSPEKKVVNASTRTMDRTIVFHRGLWHYMDSEEEVAAILSHEISHAVDSYKRFSSLGYYFNPKKYEYKADKNAIDYLVKAGYNPISFIVVMNKVASQYTNDCFLTHPLTSKRLMEVYEYIYHKYPYYLANNSYKDNIYYQNFLLTSYDNRQKLKQKIESNSAKKVRYK